MGKDKVTFQTKLEEAAQMIIELYHAYKIPVLVVADSWFGNNGLWGPVHKQLGPCFHLISRLRCSSNLFDLPEIRKEKKRGRPKKYGSLLGKVSELAVQYQNQSQSYQVDLYGRLREVLAFDRVFMLKTLKCPVRVVWVYRKTQWVALFSTDLSLSV